MAFQEKEGTIEWKMHFASPIEKVYTFLTTDDGRGKFWAEATNEQHGIIEFTFLNYPKHKASIVQKDAPRLFRLIYFGTETTFELQSTEDEGTDLMLTALTQNEKIKWEMAAGWVSVLMTMKGAVDHGIDLRNHHPQRSWQNGYADN
ncbi:MAG: hypothetical protein HKN87_21130 [Saprospiraceae bacterium]|nr:hypothetical protein [Saprospiraceae bacterium]